MAGTTQRVEITPELAIGGDAPLLLIAGPCVIESADHALKMASAIRTVADRVGVGYVFKSSYDKANRSSIHSFRGPGLEEGLATLERVRREVGVPILSDVHDVAQATAAGQVLDVLQVPAFLCRQTDLLVAAARTGRVVNVKKGQFLAPDDVGNILDKLTESGCTKGVLTERGTTFGYRNLVVDMRGLAIVRERGAPVVYDATHSMQLPGGLGDASGGMRAYIAPVARAAVAAGVDGVFMEVHDDPDAALSDGPNSLPLDQLEGLLRSLVAIDRAARESA